MTLAQLPQHPDRIALANELHARPFPVVQAPGRAACVAIERDPLDPEADRRALERLLDHYGAPHPAPDASHLTASLGKVTLRWERHTEFVTYAFFDEEVSDPPFSGDLFSVFPPDWMQACPGRVLTSVLLHIERTRGLEAATARLAEIAREAFVEESLAAAHVLDDDALVAGDFRLDAQGNIRFAVLVAENATPERIGRVVQRVIEIETYRAVAMLTLPLARDVFQRLAGLDRQLGQVVAEMSEDNGNHKQKLDQLLELSAQIERFSADTAFRFSAADAYSAIVHQRVKVLRERRIAGVQLFSEFLMRRFEPAMRTCRAAQRRLQDISDRAGRASRLLSTRVTVDTNLQNRKLLEKMERRVALQLRLQETVEGLSVVAISYYAVNLLAKLLHPAAEHVGISEKWLFAALVPPVVIFFALAMRRVRRLAEERARS